MIVAGPRVYAKMASDGVFPDLLGATLRNDMRIPATAVWLQVILASIVVWFSSLKSLLDYLGFTLSVSAATTVACIFWSRRQRDKLSHRLVYSAIAVVYVAATMALAMLSAINRPQQLIGFGFTVVSGVALFLLFRKTGAGPVSVKSDPK
jgi:APA family basic amino acid/polyamine antiporter